MIRCILSDAKVPKSFWVKIIHIAADLINLSLSTPLDGDVPETVWTIKYISYKHLRMSDCRAYAHIPKDEYLMLTDGGELDCFEEAMPHQHKGEWVKAMQKRVKSLNDNHTYNLVKLHKGKRKVKNKWVYRLKTGNNS